MAFYWNPRAPLIDSNGFPLVSAFIYYGDPNVDPIANPKTIYLDADFQTPAQNPQLTDDTGNTSQGTIYLDGEYSILVQDSNLVQKYNVPSIVGISDIVNVSELGPITSSGPIRVSSTGDAIFESNQGVGAGAVGGIRWFENNDQKYAMIKQAIVDGGALELINIVTGDVVARWNTDGSTEFLANGFVHMNITPFGIDMPTAIGSNAQVAIAGGDIDTLNGAVQGDPFGIVSVTRTSEGEATVVLQEQAARVFNLNPQTNSHRVIATDIATLSNAIAEVNGGAGDVRQINVESYAIDLASGITTFVDNILPLVVWDTGRIGNT